MEHLVLPGMDGLFSSLIMRECSTWRVSRTALPAEYRPRHFHLGETDSRCSFTNARGDIACLRARSLACLIKSSFLCFCHSSHQRPQASISCFFRFVILRILVLCKVFPSFFWVITYYFRDRDVKLSLYEESHTESASGSFHVAFFVAESYVPSAIGVAGWEAPWWKEYIVESRRITGTPSIISAPWLGIPKEGLGSHSFFSTVL